MPAKKTFSLTMPPTAQLIAGLRSGVRPGQIFRDKRRQSRVNRKAALCKQVREEA